MQVFYYPSATEDIYGIWKATLEKWSEKQADEYVLGLYETSENLYLKKVVWRKISKEYVAEITENTIFFIRYKRHFIFFRELEKNQIGVIAVLYDGMDIPKRIREKLKTTTELLA